jgi:hypothetical protein
MEQLYFVFKIHEENWDGMVEIILRDRSKKDCLSYYSIILYLIDISKEVHIKYHTT